MADFGCARKVKGETLVTTTISGSPAYMAPEQLEGADLTDKIDVWAFGVLMWEIIQEQGFLSPHTLPFPLSRMHEFVRS